MRRVSGRSKASRRVLAASGVATLLAAGSLGVAGMAGAQNPAQSYGAHALYRGDLSFGHRYTSLNVTCIRTTPETSPGSCHAEGTFTIKVSAAAKRKLGLSSATVGKGVLTSCGVGISCGRQLTIPAAVKPKLLADFKKANRKCSCGSLPPVAGRISVSLTGPAGLPAETFADSVTLAIGSNGGSGQRGWAVFCTSNWVGTCDGGGSGADG
jgi:hypothetical protein